MMDIEADFEAFDEANLPDEVQSFLNFFSSGCCVWSLNQKKFLLNSHFKSFLGYKDAFEVDGNTWKHIIYPADYENFHFALNEYLGSNHKAVYRREIRYVTQSGQIKWVLFQCQKYNVLNQSEDYLIGFNTDITDFKEQELSLSDKLLELDLFLEASKIVNHFSDFDDVSQKLVNLICKMTQWPVGHVYLPSEASRCLVPSRIWFYQDECRVKFFLNVTHQTKFKMGVGLPGRVWKSKKPVWIADMSKYKQFRGYKHAKEMGIHAGVGFPILVNGKVIAVFEFFSFEPHQENERLLEIFSSFSSQLAGVLERKEAESRLLEVTHSDALTCLPNRADFQAQLSRVLKKSRIKNQQFALLILDIDDFKRVNDILGHDIGDLLLIEMTQSIQKILLGSDYFARIGGDEFVVIMECIESPNEAAKLAEKIVTLSKCPVYIQNHEIITSISVGIAVYPISGDTEETLFKHADVALYSVKQNGRAHYTFFSKKLNQERQAVVLIENHLHHAITQNEFSLIFQPIIDLTQHRIHSIEVLLRWHNKKFGLIPPDTFIPIAEDMKLLPSITEWIINTLFTNEHIIKLFKHDANFRLSINASPSLLLEQSIYDNLSHKLNKANIHPSRIGFEITENELMHNIELIIQAILMYSELGVQFYIDDFGTGYSSLSYLKKLPIDYLKIDKMFTQGCPADSNDVAITTATIQLAHSLGLKVVAEGVETQDQANFLKSQHCDYVQGFHYSKPIEMAELLVFMGDFDLK